MLAVFKRLVDDYFAEFEDAFVKSTGDGLFLVIPYDANSLSPRLNAVIDASVRCVADFAELLSDNAMINFETPNGIGFGITRGAACALVAPDPESNEELGKPPAVLTIDYSGAVLNLAARLQDLARPSGVIVDGEAGMDHVAPKLVAEFTNKTVYVRSIAEREARDVWVQANLVEVPESNLHPMAATWITKKTNVTVSHLRNPHLHLTELPSHSLVEDSLSVTLERQGPGGLMSDFLDPKSEFVVQYRADQPFVGVVGGDTLFEAHSLLTDDGFEDEQVDIVIRYQGFG